MEKLIRIIAGNRIVKLFLGIIVVLLFILIGVSIKGKAARKADPMDQKEVGSALSVSAVPDQAQVENTAAALPDQTGSVNVSSDAESVEETAGAAVPKGEVTITISAAGDCTLAKDDGMDYDVSFPASYEEHGPEWFMSGVSDVFGTDDLTIVNFEGTLSTRGERAEKTYAFRGDPDYVKVLTSGSVEACNLANNHAFDYGRDAYEDTKKYLEEAGIVTFGFDRSQVIEIKGIKIGLVGIYELEEELGVKPLLLQEIEKVKAEGAELVIVSFHWGDEGSYDLNDVQIELAHTAVDAGANLVLGHHPHRVQGIGRYNGVHICYSMGNFVFGGHASPSDMDCYIFRQTFTFEDGKLQDNDEYLVIPCSISSAYDYNNYRPRILEDEEGTALLNKLDSLL